MKRTCPGKLDCLRVSIEKWMNDESVDMHAV